MASGNDFLKKLLEIQVRKESVSRKIKDLLSEYESKKICIPAYQRSFVWENDKQCRFIESIFLQVPIPPIFFLEKYDHINEEDGLESMVWEVIDGVQRLTTLENFYSGRLRLSGLQRLQDLNQSKISQLQPAVKEFFLSRSIDVICIQSGTNPEVQFEVFGRLNQGSVALNAQELRNCMFHGQFNDFLISCSGNATYRELLKSFPKFNQPQTGKPDKNRMQDVELILRFFTLMESYIPEQNRYLDPRVETLNDYMRKQVQRGNVDPDDLRILQDNLQNIFTNALELVRKVFFPDHFKRFSKTPEKASFTVKTLSQAVFDVQMLGFLEIDSQLVSEHRKVIKETFVDLCCYNSDFAYSISRGTNTSVSERLSIWKQQLQDILTNPSPYYNKLDLKKKLFTGNAVCPIKGTPITSLDDCDIYQGQLCHRSNLLGNDLFQYPQQIKAIKTTEFTIAGQNYEKDDFKEATNLILDYIRDGIALDEEYHLKRIESLDFCGTPDDLSKAHQLESKIGSQLKLVPIYQNIYLRTGNRTETVERLTILASLFRFMQPFEIK